MVRKATHDEETSHVLEHPEEQPAEEKKTRHAGRAVWVGLLVVVLAALGIGYALVLSMVKNLSESPFVVQASNVFGIPAATVNSSKILYGEYRDNMRAMKQFYETDTSGMTKPTPEQMSDYVISRLIINKMLAQVADHFDVEVKGDEIDAFVNTEVLANFTGDDAKKQANDEINKRYGWSLDQFTNQIVRPTILEQNLIKAFDEGKVQVGDEYMKDEVRASHILFTVEDESKDAEVKAKAQEVLDRVKKGEDFAALAKEFGSDGTKETGGDLGWFGRGQMVPEFETAAFGLEKGQLSQELVKTQFGYHILRVDDKRRAADFTAYMDNELRNAKLDLLDKIHNPFEEFLNQAAQEQTEMPTEGDATSTSTESTQ